MQTKPSAAPGRALQMVTARQRRRICLVAANDNPPPRKWGAGHAYGIAVAALFAVAAYPLAHILGL